MDYKQVDLSKINYTIDSELKRIMIKYGKHNSIKITTPVMTIPFGIDHIFNKYYIKLKFDDYKTNIEMESFFNLMMTIEEHINNYIEEYVDDKADVVSEFKFSDKFDPLMNSKLLSYNKSVKTKIITGNGSDVDYTYVRKKDKVKCVLELNGVWKVKNNFCYKWTIIEMKIIE